MTKQLDNEGQLFTDLDESLTLDQENRTITDRLINRKNQDPDWTDSHYGHAALNLAIIQRNADNFEKSPEEQRALLIKQRDQLVARFGSKIIDFLKEDLQVNLNDL